MCSLLVGDVEVARAIHRHTCWDGSATTLTAGPPTPTKAPPPVPRNRRDDPPSIHPPDHEVPGVSDVEVARTVHRHVCGIRQPSRDCRAPVSLSL